MRRVSRRRFLRSAAGAGIGAGALALVGCSSPETYNERRAGGTGGTEPAATPRSGQAKEQEYEQQVEAAAAAVEVQEVDQDQADSVLRGDSEALRRQNDWRRLRDASGRGGGPRFGGSIRLVSPAPWYWAPITPAGAPPVSAFGNPSLMPLLYSQLITLRVDDQTDAHGNTIEGDLASEWEIADETTIIFRLRPGVSWPEREPLEGGELTASDVRHGQERYLDGAAHQRAAYRTVDRIEADDAERSVSFHLTRPTAYLLNAMTAPDHVILPPEANFDALAEQWVPGSFGPSTLVPPVPGTGPFDYQFSGGPGSTWSMRRKSDYFKSDGDTDRLPYLDVINGGVVTNLASQTDPSVLFEEMMAAWGIGRFDGLVLRSRDELDAALDRRPDAVFQIAPPMPWRGSEVRMLGGERNLISDSRVRIALSKAVDRGRLADLWHDGLAAPDCGMHWPAVEYPAVPDAYREWPWALDELGDAYQYDPAAARALLTAAGYDSVNPLLLVFDSGIGFESSFETGSLVDLNRRESVATQWKDAFDDLVRIATRDPMITMEDTENGPVSVMRPHEDVNISMRDGAEWGRLGGLPFPADPDPSTVSFAPAPAAGSESGYAARGDGDDGELQNLWELQARELDPAERSDILEQIRAKRAEHVQSIHLVNPYGIFARRRDVFNVGATYFAHNPMDYPKQFEQAWKIVDGPGS